MRRFVAASGLVVALGGGIGPESYTSVHGFPSHDSCVTEIVEEVEINEFSLADVLEKYESDVERSHVNGNAPTKTDNEVGIEIDTSEHPNLYDYAENNTEQFGSYTLARSNVVIKLYTDNDAWTDFDAASFEADIEQAMRKRDPDSIIESVSNNCHANMLFEDGALSGNVVDVYILGAGDVCIAKNSLINRDLNECSARGRHRQGSIYLTPPSSDMYRVASKSLAHEFTHYVDYALLDHYDAHQREYRGYRIGNHIIRGIPEDASYFELAA